MRLMQLTEEYQDRVLGYRHDKGVSACPACGEEEFMVGEDLFTVVQGASVVHDSLLMQGMHTVAVVCTECGHTVMFWSERMPLPHLPAELVLTETHGRLVQTGPATS